jgi:hypothetical protein
MLPLHGSLLLCRRAAFREVRPTLLTTYWPCRTFRFRYQGGGVTGTAGDPFTAGFDTGAYAVPVDPADAMYGELDMLIVR